MHPALGVQAGRGDRGEGAGAGPHSSRLLVRALCSGGGSALVLLLLSHPGCSTQPERELRVLVRTPFMSAVGEHLGGIVRANACDGVVAFSSDLRIVPALASAWSTPSDTIWRFELRRGVSFHDGRRVTAADVKHTLDQALARPGYWLSSRLPRVKSVRTAGEHLLEIETGTPEPSLLNMLASLCVVPSGAEITAFSRLVASGPYRLRSLRADQEAVFERFDGHWQGRPYWSRGVFQLDPDGRSRLSRLAKGEVDLVESPPLDALAALDVHSSVRLIERPVAQIGVLGLDARPGSRNPFARRGVRRALAMCLDRSVLCRDALGGHASPAVQLGARGVFGFELERPDSTPDVAAARAALAEKGLRAGLSAPLLFTERDRRLAESIASQAAVAGFRLELVELPWADLDRRLHAGSATAALYRLTFPYLDASDALFDLHTRTADGRYGTSNFSGFSDPELDRALEASEVELEPEERLAHLRRAMDRALKSFALIPVVAPSELYAARRGLSLQSHGHEWIRLEDVREDEAH